MVATVLVGAVLGFVVWETSPEALLARVGFFLCLFAAIAAAVATAAYFASFRLFALKRHQGDVRRAWLQGLPPAALLTALAGLQSVRLLNLGLVVALLVVAAIAEWLLWPRELADVARRDA